MEVGEHMGNEATDVTLNRDRGLGGSDEPAIMELSPFKTRWQLLREKAGIEENTFTGNFYTAYGNAMEPKIRDYINKKYGYHFKPDYDNLERQDLEDYYHADGYDSDKLAVLEIKTTSDVVTEWDASDYDIDFKEIAYKHYKKYLVQLAKGMWMFDADQGILAVYERDDNSEEFDPERLQIFWNTREEIDPLIGEVLQADEDFRKDYKFLVEHKDATEDMLPSRQALVDISAKEYQLGKQMVSGLFLLSHKKEITDLLDQISADFKVAMEKRGITKVVLPDGTKISYTATSPDKTIEAFDEEAFQKDYPDIYSKYMKLVTKKGRAGFVKVQVKKK